MWTTKCQWNTIIQSFSKERTNIMVDHHYRLQPATARMSKVLTLSLWRYRGQTKQGLRGSNVKIRKYLLMGYWKQFFGGKSGNCMWDKSIWIIYFEKLWNLVKSKPQIPKMRDFEWFGEVVKIIMINIFGGFITLSWYLKPILNQFSCNTHQIKG